VKREASDVKRGFCWLNIGTIGLSVDN